MLLNKQTHTVLRAWLENPANPLCLESQVLENDSRVVKYLLAELGIAGHATHHTQTIGQVIPIDEIRQIRKFLKLKPANSNDLRAVVIINSQKMNDESQNALLKTLEELPENTVLITTADNIDSLKQTVISRFWVCPILPVTPEDAMNYYRDSQRPEKDITEAYQYSRGNPEILMGLIEQDSSKIAGEIALAKTIITATPFARLAYIDELVKSENTRQHLISLKIILASVLEKAAASQNGKGQIIKVTSALKKIDKLLCKQNISKLGICDLYINM